VQHWLPSVISDEPGVVLCDLSGALESGYQRPVLPLVTKIDGRTLPLPEDDSLIGAGQATGR